MKGTLSIVIPVVRTMVQAHPDVVVEVRASSHNADLVAEGVHVALRAGPLSTLEYGTRLLHRGHHGIYAAPALVESWPCEHPRDLVNAPWIHFAPRPLPTPMSCAGAEDYALAYRPSVVSDSPQGAADMALEGMGFILLPEIIARTHALSPVLPGWCGEPIEFHAVTPSPRPSDRKTLRFIELLVDEFAERPS